MWGIASVLWGIPSVLWRLFSTVGDNVSTVGDNVSTVGDNVSTVGDSFSTVEDSFSTVEGIQYIGGITSVLWRVFSTVGEEFYFRHVWSLIMTKRYQSSLYYYTKFSFGSFSKIQADFMHFESWTGALQVKPCFEIIYNFIFRVLFLSFKFSCLCDCT